MNWLKCRDWRIVPLSPSSESKKESDCLLDFTSSIYLSYFNVSEEIIIFTNPQTHACTSIFPYFIYKFISIKHKLFQSFGIRSSVFDSFEIKLDMLLKGGNFAQYIEPSYRSRPHAGLLVVSSLMLVACKSTFSNIVCHFSFICLLFLWNFVIISQCC